MIWPFLLKILCLLKTWCCSIQNIHNFPCFSSLYVYSTIHTEKYVVPTHSKDFQKNLLNIAPWSGLLIWHESTFFSNRLHLLLTYFYIFTDGRYDVRKELENVGRSFGSEHFLRPFFCTLLRRRNAGNSWKIDIFCPIKSESL